jgi:peptide/nickel transport system permease protein
MGFLLFLKQPGSYRIFAGGVLVFLLAVATVVGPRWARYSADEMDLEHLLVPPEPEWLLKVMTTAGGRKILLQHYRGSAAERVSGEEENEGLKALTEGTSTTPDAQQDFSMLRGHGHLLGTDKNGRDLVALLVAGARNCFLPGLVACAVALGLGIPLGLLAGYYDGRLRRAVQIFNGTLLSMPRMVLILVVICALEPNVYLTMAVLGVTLIPRVSELIATRVRTLSRMGFILAAKEGGLSDFRILTRHLFWYQNRAVFFIQFSLIMAESILTETTLSYLQFGTKPPEVSWGNIIEGSRSTFFSGQYWITFFPAVAIILAILGFFYLGDGLNARQEFREGR